MFNWGFWFDVARPAGTSTTLAPVCLSVPRLWSTTSTPSNWSPTQAQSINMAPSAWPNVLVSVVMLTWRTTPRASGPLPCANVIKSVSIQYVPAFQRHFALSTLHSKLCGGQKLLCKQLSRSQDGSGEERSEEMRGLWRPLSKRCFIDHILKSWAVASKPAWC